LVDSGRSKIDGHADFDSEAMKTHEVYAKETRNIFLAKDLKNADVYA
jgi:hypothetical protein